MFLSLLILFLFISTPSNSFCTESTAPETFPCLPFSGYPFVMISAPQFHFPRTSPIAKLSAIPPLLRSASPMEPPQAKGSVLHFSVCVPCRGPQTHSFSFFFLSSTSPPVEVVPLSNNAAFSCLPSISKIPLD